MPPVTEPSADSPHSAPVTRGLGLLGVLSLGLNTIIGSGIFRLPAELARDVGHRAPLAFLVGALVLLPIALSYARAARACPADGSAFAYATHAFGPRVGVVVGFSIVVATVTTLASALVAVPGQLGIGGGPRTHGLVAAGLTVALGALSRASLRGSARLGTPLALFKAGALVVLAAAGFFASPEAATTGVASPRAFGSALLVVVFALSGFEAAAVPGDGAERASYTLPRAILGSLVGAALVYAALQAALLRLVPDLAGSERPVADGAGALLGPVAQRLVGALGALSLFGLGHAMAVTAPIVVRAVGSAFPGSPAAVRASRHAAVGVTAVTVLLVLTLDFRALVDFTSVLVMGQYAVTAIAAPILARDVRPRAWAVPALAVTAALYVAAHASLVEVGLAAASLLPGLALAFRGPVAPADRLP